MMDRRILVKDLLILTGRTITSTALEAGIDPTNLSRFLKGHATVSERKMEKVLELLGIEFPATLSPNRVHLWTLKTGDLSSLVRVLSWSSSSLYELVFLAPDNDGVRGYLPENLPLAIYDFKKKIRILLRRKFDPWNPEREAIDSLVVSGLIKWKDNPFFDIFPSSSLDLRIDSRIFENFLAGNVSLEEYDRVLGPREAETLKGKCVRETPMTWGSFVAEMERRGIRPEEALELIDRGKEEGR